MISKIKKPVSILLSVIMVFSLFTIVPITASAETITTVTNSHDISINSDTTITGTASNTKITVTGDCTIILDGLNLTNTSNRGKCGIDIQSGTVNLIIKGENKITAGGQNGDSCPIGVRENATLIISGYNDENDGNILTVIGTTNGKAAIGGAWDQWTCGTIVINSGTINATGGGYGASVIGKGGNRNTTKSVTINGGVITTTLKDTLQGATAIGGGNMSVSYSPSYDTPLIMNGVTVYPTVTWMNYDGTELKKDEIVAEGTTPSYGGATPEKAEDDDYTYTFSGWTDGTTNYGLTDTLPVVTGNVTYTAQFDETPKPHQHDGITFDKWTSDNSLPTAAGNYVLTSDVTLSGTWTVPEGETNLCLAGYTIRQSGSGSVILLNNANKKLTVYDDGTTGSITGGNTTGDGGGVNITAGTFTLKGGNIEGNVASNGGGVSVSGQSSYFTMAGGTVRYNAGYTYTGGVLQIGSGKFTMTGGEIRYNVGKVYGGVGIADAQPSMSGNAVVKDNVFFNDITASNTKITKTESGYTIASGGTPCDVRHATALKINVTGAFESGAQIGIFNNNQTAEFTSGFDANNPGGAPADYFFSNDSNRFIMLSANKEAQLGGYFTVIWKNEDGTVLETDENVSTGTTPAFNGTEPTKESDGVATFEFIGWTPAVSPVTGDVTYTATYNAILPDHEHDGIVYKGWASKNSLPTEAGNYYLGYDVTLPSTWTVSKNIRLCLNGNGITKNGGNVITIVSGSLTIDDCGTKTHYFDVNNGKAVNVNTTPGENRQSFTGGYITGGTGQGYDGYFWSEGGGIYLDGGNLILNGGTILGNSAAFGGGVGIFSGTMTMNGGTVCYNTGNAGISFRTGSNDYNRGRGASTGYFVMNGGLVANNSSGVTTAGYSYGSDYATYNGGRIVNNVNTGIYSQNITIAGDIEITGNKYGAGFSNTFSVSGNPVITGNTTSNLSINNGKTINTGTLGENAKIGITMSNPGAFTNGYDANNTIEPTEIFTADDPTTFVAQNAAGEVKLGIYVWTASFNTGGGSGTMDPIEVQKERSFNLPECTFIAPEGKLFLNWSDGTNTYNPGDSCTMTADTVFTAQWIDGIKVSFKANGGSGVMEELYSYPDYKLPACGFTAPGGKFFNGWLSSADNQVYQPGDTVTLTAETQFTAQWAAEVNYQFDFENGLPTGWQTSNGNWYLNANGGDHIVFPAHSGQKNMTYYRGGYGTYGELLTSSFDMSNAESATLGFWYTNRNWGGDIDQLVVSYRVGEGDWVQLFATSGNHESWTEEKITMPSEAFAENVRFRFSVNGNYGYGVALDDVELNLTGSKDLIAGHSLTLDGNIGVNFYLDPSVAGMTANQVTADNFSYSFAWADVDKLDGKPLVSVSDQAKSKAFRVSNDGKYIIVTCHVCAAEMSCGVNASFTLGEKTESEVYSVRQYGDEVFNATDEEIDERFGGAEEYGKLTDLMTKMLDYGAKAQTVFGINKGYLANKGLSYNMLSDTPDFDGAIQTANRRLADNLASADFFGENFKAPSLVFLDYSTLKLYFENKDGSLSTLGLTPWNNYFYIKHENIAASELDTLQTFTVSGKTFRYSALDYAKVLAASENTDNANLAKALYWYNKAANAYFG